MAKYLQESRDFASMAFADKIKEEYGITNEDFEAAKITGEIDRLRQELWNFSAQKKKNDPEYFIKLVIDEAIKLEKSIVITDIRTPEELSAVKKIGAKIYFVCRSMSCLRNEYLEESKIKSQYIRSKIIPKTGEITTILNFENSSYRFIRRLEKLFFIEDIMDLVGSVNDLLCHNYIWRNTISNYSYLFDIIVSL